ncbi:hypothetical protein YQE_05451, partial [Dendroctonus ponderosae]
MFTIITNSDKIAYKSTQLDGYIPGQDYPIYSEIPAGLSFRCEQNRAGFGTGAYPMGKSSVFCAPMGPSSIKSLEFAIGGSMWIVQAPPTTTESMKIST